MKIEAIGKYAAVRRPKPAVQTRGQPLPKGGPHASVPNFFIPKLLDPKSQFEDWYFQELREGGMLNRYLARERAQTDRRLRRVARQMHGVKRNLKSDFELKASVPAREFFRWKATDPDFWRDDQNLKSLKRDNPDAVIFV